MEESHFKELQNRHPLKISFIKIWLLEHINSFNEAIEKTECYKWKRYKVENSTFIFPCVCANRNAECIFIETYRSLEKLVDSIKTEELYNNLLQNYSNIKQNKDLLFKWINAHKEIGKELSLISSKLQIVTQSEPYQYLIFEIDKTETPKLWEFQELFNKNYHSQEYKNYFNK